LGADFITALLQQPISGIPAQHWYGFLKIFSEGVDAKVVERRLKTMRNEAEKPGLTSDGLEAFDRIEQGLRDLLSKI
jgi:hypothetical protein